ncbi:MAG: DUF4258 domain-containing protein [Ignavibacteria bacterium]|nr:DUF4258 domain-containing protein [Ignavibacteria bacterium]
MTKNILSFIKECVKQERILWTYHVNMRLSQRSITSFNVINSIDSFEIIEEYPDDKYLQSYLIYAKDSDFVFHLVVAVDETNNCITVVTAYKPTLEKWGNDFKTRRRR